jgi:MinD-like ATPase involved in chromosome partitioning or flagellar assembly
MSGILLALDPATEDRLLRDIVAGGHDVLGRVAGAEDVIAAVDATPPDVVLLNAAPRCLTAEVLQTCDRIGVRVIALAGSEADRRNAVGVGLHEVIDADAPWSDIEPLLTARLPASAREGEGSRDEREGKSRVLAVWGPAGAPGRTTLSITLAAEIAAAGHRVALIDADPYGGTVAPALGLLDEAPGFAAACRLAGSDSLTIAELDRVAQRYGGSRGFRVLTGIARPSRWPELSEDRVRRTVDACRDWVDYVLIDTGFSIERDEEISSDLFAPRRNAATVAAVQSADHVMAVASADPVGLARFLRAHADLVDLLDGQRLTVVANRVRAAVIGLNPGGQVAQTLLRFAGIEHPVLVPHDAAAADAALLAGATLRDVAPRSPALAAVARFVRDDVLPLPPPALRRRLGRRGRMTAAVG